MFVCFFSKNGGIVSGTIHNFQLDMKETAVFSSYFSLLISKTCHLKQNLTFRQLKAMFLVHFLCVQEIDYYNTSTPNLCF